ncbi:helix-turn-helix domain-containing protein [Azospirillum sp.]|uniref:helix-turn-helix domain-containing protein n=1 Tax=Azospirillum sp. TaxID=34012 RepID=UPI002D62AEB9|nr:helix-turn-helix domain-containing protein [Azospirillum sp.]HYD66953.1 helix-turn-helix domain-containing protein [Azospirillum sp.]
MAKSAFDDIMAGIQDMADILNGIADPSTYRVHVPERIDVRGIRKNLGLSQAEFAARFGFSVHTLRKWEQEGRQPEGPARAYLKVIERDPEAVRKALWGSAE